ncbi:hypothetical protein B9Z19DRAFT_1125072 [Tuber borchii]|uniref:Uncharacterized protein n=1 Tax=Tuber borchii TaxID=42251 RepID=A0A2T6ZVI4_TUBBO|nr:hypothetical protein B9Z19DRAFT_1125072 [Tuber borchii]
MTPATVAKNHHRRAQVKVKEVNSLEKDKVEKGEREEQSWKSASKIARNLQERVVVGGF